MHFSQISVSDLILVDEDGVVVVGDEPINAAAFAIHSEIHKARDQSIAQSAAPSFCMLTILLGQARRARSL